MVIFKSGKKKINNLKIPILNSEQVKTINLTPNILKIYEKKIN